MGQAFSNITSIFANEEDRKHGKSPQVEVVHSSTKGGFSRQDSTFELVECFSSDTAPREHEANRKHGKSPQVEVVHCPTKVEFSRQDSTFEVVERFKSDSAPRKYEANQKHGKSPEVEIVHCAKKLEFLRQLESISEVLERFRSEYEANRKHGKSPQVEVVHCAKKIEFLMELESISEVLERFIREYEAEQLCKRVLKAEKPERVLKAEKPEKPEKPERVEKPEKPEKPERVLKAEKPERWIKHYSSSHKILLVGEGDFSFSACLARAFVSADNMHATSLDSIGFLMKNYNNSMSNINELESRGCTVIHGVDVAEMAKHYMLKGQKFDRIVYNFPLAGFFWNESRESQIRRNQKLVSSLFNNAKRMMSENGEIHVTHKSMGFFLQWNLELLAMQCSLCLKEKVRFKKKDYPGYGNKYGFGGNKNFDCKSSKTYKFVLQNQSK